MTSRPHRSLHHDRIPFSRSLIKDLRFGTATSVTALLYYVQPFLVIYGGGDESKGYAILLPHSPWALTDP